MKDREISWKSRNLCCFESISFAILFGLFSCGIVNSSQASHFAKRNFKHKQNGEGKEITDLLGFPVFHAKPQQRKWQRWNDLQWNNLRPRLNPVLSHLPSVDQRINARNSADTSDLFNNWTSSKWNLYFCFFFLFWRWSVEGSVGVVRGPVRR